MSNYLNEEQVFVRGPWKGEDLDDVASDVPEYLNFLLDEKEDLEWQERLLMMNALDAYEDES